jgi:uncharacterized membrane protein (UPF0127 family)
MKKRKTQKHHKDSLFKNVKKLKTRTFAVIFCLITIFIVLHTSKPIDAEEIIQFNQDPKNYNVKLQILDQNKKIVEFMVAVPSDDNKKIYGLMKINHLPENQGMLFVFATKRVVNMWMKNTKIPLDMLFIDDNNVITNIKENNPPLSLDLINSEYSVSKILEINAGLVQKYHIKTGQKIKIS